MRWINIDWNKYPNKGICTNIDWTRDPNELKNVDLLDPYAKRRAMREVYDMITSLVAGDVAEAIVDTEKTLVSTRIPDCYLCTTEDQPLEKSDRGFVAWLITLGFFNINVVKKAEKRARNILDRRATNHAALVQELLENGYIERPQLASVLDW